MGEKYLLDTHALIWALYAPDRLPDNVRDIIASGSVTVMVSAVSAYEVALKFNQGRLDLARQLALNFAGEVAVPGFGLLPLDARHAMQAGLLALAHKDPFDRMLIAQAQIEQLVLVSNEKLFDQFGIIRLW